MDYVSLAEELLKLRIYLVRVPTESKVNAMAKGEMYALNYLMEHDGYAYPKELSSNMMVSTARIATLLNRMEAKGYVRRCKDVEDNRQTIVRLTEDGLNVVKKGREFAVGKIIEVLKGLGPEDAEACVRIVTKIVHIFMENEDEEKEDDIWKL